MGWHLWVVHGACGALQPAAPDIAPLCLHHMTRDLPALGRGWGIGVGWGMNQHFGNPSLSPVKAPAKGQYETRLKSPAVPLSIVITTQLKSNSRMTNALVRKTAWIGSCRGGKVIQQWNVRLPDRALFIPLELLVRDATEISHTSGRCRWTKYGPANGRREHPLPHDEISSACSAGNVTLGAGKGSRGGVFVLNLRLDDKPSLIVLWLSWTSATRAHPQKSFVRPNLDQFEFLPAGGWRVWGCWVGWCWTKNWILSCGPTSVARASQPDLN